MALVAPGEPADLRPPPRPGAVACSVSPWHLLDAPTLRRLTTHEGQGTSTSRQSVGEALKELQSKFAAFSQQVAADVQTLQSENAVLRGQLQDEKDARSVQVQKLHSILGKEKAKAVRVAADVQTLQSENAVLRGQLQDVRADVKEVRSEITALRDHLREKESAQSVQKKQLQQLQSKLGLEKAKAERVAGELQKTRQELDNRFRELKEKQDRSLRVAEQLALKVLVPEFSTDPALPELQYSHGNRRCHCTGEEDEPYTVAVAKEGFTSGRQQFTVLVETGCFSIAVAVANAPSTGYQVHRQGVFLDGDGKLYMLDGDEQLYTTSKPFNEGSQVTMRLDFDEGTASYEVDGVDLGVVEGLTLPEGLLYPAVLFDLSGEHVAEFVPYAPELAARA